MGADHGMSGLIEEYLRARGVRYFRGHHDDEFFYLVGFRAGADRGRLNVHLEVCEPGRDAVRIRIGPDRFYPADQRERLIGVAVGWNAADPRVTAAVYPSCDPALVGVVAEITHRPDTLTGLAGVVEDAVSASVELFGRMHAAALPELRDAG